MTLETEVRRFPYADLERQNGGFEFFDFIDFPVEVIENYLTATFESHHKSAEPHFVNFDFLCSNEP